MDVEFRDDDLDRLETDPEFTMNLSRELVKSFRRRMQSIRAATDERDLRAIRGNRFKRPKGDRAHQHSIRLDRQYRLVVELAKKSRPTIVIVGIEDYH